MVKLFTNELGLLASINSFDDLCVADKHLSKFEFETPNIL